MSWPWRTTSRTASATGVPPGFLVKSTSRPASVSQPASRAAWVLLPDQSTPSKVTNIARLMYGVDAGGRDGGRRLHRVEPGGRTDRARRRRRDRRQLHKWETRTAKPTGHAARA